MPFRGRRYKSKHHNRNGSKKKRREPVFQSGAENLIKAGGKHQTYKETLTTSVYSWQNVPPLCRYNKTSLAGPVKSLKSLCAFTVAKHVEDLEYYHLDLAPWACWRLVWTNVLKLQNDSFDVLKMFASQFYKEQSFRCHSPVKLTLSFYTSHVPLVKTRDHVINALSIPESRNHRFENIFFNISINNFSSYLHRLHFSSWIVLDLSHVTSKLSNEDHFKILNIPNLVALDLSNSEFVDDRFLYNISRSISESKLKQLTILRISNCRNVTEIGLRHLLNISKYKRFDTSLSYIESDVRIVPGSFTLSFSSIKKEKSDEYIDGTRWTLLNSIDGERDIMKGLSLALKLYMLYKEYGYKVIARALENETNSQAMNLLVLNTSNAPGYLIKAKHSVILDVMFHPETLEKVDDCSHQLFLDQWKRRLVKNTRASYNYIADNNYEIGIELAPNTASKERKTSQVSSSKKKPRQINTDIKSFFGM